MSAEEQNQNDSENENMEENTEESPEENSDVDIDQSQKLDEDEEYEQKLNQYFEELEAKYGIDYANKIRQKIIGSKQLSHFLDLNAWSKQLVEMEAEELVLAKERNELIFKLVNEQMVSTQKLVDKTEEIIARSAELNEKMYQRYIKALNDDEVRSQKLDEFTREIMELKRKKWAKENEAD